jgi:hypothetical protein
LRGSLFPGGVTTTERKRQSGFVGVTGHFEYGDWMSELTSIAPPIPTPVATTVCVTACPVEAAYVEIGAVM